MTRTETMEHLDEVSKFTVLFMKDNNTDDNNNTKKAFVEFAWAESNGNYFQALKRLIENYSADYKYATLYTAIEELKASIIENTLKDSEKKEEDKSEEFF